MDRLRITWNARKSFVCPAIVAVVLVLMAGGANALANTVWHVSKASSNATCTISATTCNTIGSAVSAASNLDVILVGPGKYNESVHIETSNLAIFGAQAGKDPRTLSILSLLSPLGGGNEVWSARTDPTKESIVDATGQGSGPGYGAAFYINASYEVIDGFTIQGGTGGTYAAGIYDNVDATWQVLNNIIQNNAVGICMSDSYDGVLVQHNLIRNNNKGAVGSDDFCIPEPGFGIAAYDINNGVAITQNEFQGNLAAAIFLDDAHNGVDVTQNTSNNDGSFVVLYDCKYMSVSQNQGRNFGARGFLPVAGTTHADAAIDLVYYNYAIQISNNDLQGGRAPDYNGIAFSTLDVLSSGVDYVCMYCQVTNNRIMRFAGNGIVAEASEGSPTLYYSGVTANLVEGNGLVGILIGAAAENYYNTLINNKAENNHTNDCEDDTIGPGSGTPSTYNTWFHNIGSLSLPHGLCSPSDR